LLAFVTAQKGPVSIGEVARAFGLKNADRAALKRQLRELSDDGTLERRGKTLHHSGALASTIFADIVSRDRDGDLIAVPDEWDEANGPAPRIVVRVPHRVRSHEAAGIGDRVLLHVEDSGDADDPERYSGRVIRRIDKARQRVLGVFRALPNGGGRMQPVDKKQLGREIVIPPGATGDAKDGDLVAVSPAGAPRLGLPQGRVVERLGSLASEKAVSLIAIHAHNIPQDFRADTLTEAAAAKPVTLAGREDWRKLPIVTIDPPDAKDHDDAVFAESDADPGNAGGFVLTVAIADVAAYVTPGSALDREALVRGNSVYFPDRVVPMLPERISNDLCSLRPKEDRPALAVRIVIDASGRKKTHSFHRVMIRSAAKLAYAQAQAAIDGRPDDTTDPLLEPVLKPLYEAYAALKRAREHRSPLDLDLPERKLVLNPDGTVARVVVAERLEAHRLIEEFMILANVCAAETLERAGTPLIYRVHDEPGIEKVNALREFLKTLDIPFAKAGALRSQVFNHILHRVRGQDSEQLVSEVVLRSQAQAEYSEQNYGHFGLNLRRYAHFTSPIRRYADLIVHRALIRALKLGDDGLPESQDQAALAEIAARISAAERRAMLAERETTERLIAYHLADKVGASFEGRISGVIAAGLFVKLNETGADGFIPARTIGNEYFRYNEAAHAMVGSHSGETYRLGDPVTVKLVEAAPVAGALRFELVSDGRKSSPPPGRSFRSHRFDAAKHERKHKAEKRRGKNKRHKNKRHGQS
jgi:ribonuclease R